MVRDLAMVLLVIVMPASVLAQPIDIWGYNSNGQLGNGATTNNGTPAAPTSASGFINSSVTAVSPGRAHTLALQGGKVYSWGNNTYGHLGNNSLVDSSTPVIVASANGFTNTGVTQIASGSSDSAALQGGVVYTWGRNNASQLGNNSAVTQSAVPVLVASGNGFTNTGVSQITYGNSHGMAIQGSSLYTWGSNSFGQLGNNTTTNAGIPVKVMSTNGFDNTGATPITSIGTGTFASYAIQSGHAYTWGAGNSGILGNGGTSPSSVPVTPSSTNGFTNTGVTMIVGGSAHTLALQNGQVFAWGLNASGQLGTGNTTSSTTPVAVSGLNGLTVVKIMASLFDGYALTSTGRLFAWGDNTYGQLGQGTTGGTLSTPVEITAPNGFIWGDFGESANAQHMIVQVVPEPATLGWIAASVMTVIAMFRRVMR